MEVNFQGTSNSTITGNNSGSPEVKSQAEKQEISPSTGGANINNQATGRRERARLLALMQEQAKTTQAVLAASNVITGGAQGRSAHGPQERQQVEHLLKETLAKFERVESLLYGDQPVKNSSSEKTTLLEELSGHLDDIKQLTAKLEFPEGADMEAAQHEKKKALPKQPDHGNSLEVRIIDKCLEVVDALTPLCIAVERPRTGGNSVFDHYFQINEQLPLGADLEKMLLHAAFAQTVYAGDLQGNLEVPAPLLKKGLPQSWETMNVPSALRDSFNNVCPDIELLPDGRFYDPDSGLVMQIFENQETKQVALAFGGTSSGEKKGPLMTRLFSNPWITARQWRANLTNATGISVTGVSVPDSYDMAADIAAVLNRYLKTNRGNEWRVSLTGHSKGAAEAAYASLMNELPAVCFGTPQLGKYVLETATPKQLEAGLRNIRHYFVEGDLAPKVGDIVAPVMGRMQAHVGTGYWMKPTSEAGNGPLKALWCHELFFRSALEEAVRQKTPSS